MWTLRVKTWDERNIPRSVGGSRYAPIVRANLGGWASGKALLRGRVEQVPTLYLQGRYTHGGPHGSGYRGGVCPPAGLGEGDICQFQVNLDNMRGKTHCIRVTKTFIAPNTTYFSAASATMNSAFGIIFITEGWRNCDDSPQGWMNWKSISRVVECSWRRIGVLSTMTPSEEGNPAVAHSRYLRWSLKRTLSDDMNVMSALESETGG